MRTDGDARAAHPAAPLLQARGLAKSFPGVRALRGVSLHLARGEVLAVVGENGAGKSTLMQILAGIQQPDDGDIWLDGRPARIESPRHARELGIALIHQELDLADNLDAAANIFLGREPHRFGFIDRAREERHAKAVLERVGAAFGPRARVAALSIGEQQLVEIAKAIALDARILIMDEPTSSLSQRETERLFDVVRDLRRRGVSVIYISHRLGEVRELADRVVVLRDGQLRGELARQDIARDAMVRLMVGRDLAPAPPRRASTAAAVVLAAQDLVLAARPEAAVSLELRAGEVVGLAGLVGAGRSELLGALFGTSRCLGGALSVAGTPARIAGPRDAIRAGLALVPEDRKAQALFLDMAVGDNISVAALGQGRRLGLIDRGFEDELVAQAIERLRIDTPGPGQAVRLLSGGNQQKVVLGRWLALRPRVLLLDEPTRGVDVGARHEIYALIDQLAAHGVAVLFASSEMEEILRLSDRVLVMHDGRIAGELARPALDEEGIMHLATGGGAATDRRQRT